jgi:inorganic pyrophosphatase
VNLIQDIAPHDDQGRVRVVVETPAGSRLKLKYDPAIGSFTWSRLLAAGITFPFDYGFVPRTLSGDGDALDALVYTEVASYPGVVVPGTVVGALRVEQQRDGQPAKRNDRLIVVPTFDHHRAHISCVSELAERAKGEIEEFFRASLVLTGKRVLFRGWADAAEAGTILADAIDRYDADLASRTA